MRPRLQTRRVFQGRRHAGGRDSVNASRGALEDPRNYWSSIRVFHRPAVTAPSFELIESFYDSRNMSGASPYSSAAVMRVSGKRIALNAYDRHGRGLGYNHTGALLESTPRPRPRRAGSYGSSIAFAGNRVVFKQLASTASTVCTTL